MRKIVGSSVAVLAASIAIASCRTTPSSGPGAGAPSASAAVQEFLAAAHAGDMRAMGALFGTSSGSVTRRDDPNDVEKRMRALQCYLNHDVARVVDDLPGMGADRRLDVELRQGNLVRRTTFNAVPGPHQRWFVRSFDVTTITDLCHP